ncbi:MAG: anaerobic sulfatase maturase [Sedimentisphaerales bacterium]|nr:anaerobic sulfatase maturase [Sedimentisphaerales bacterium]
MPPFTLLIKPAGPDCNLNCAYCFYTRNALFKPRPYRMSDAILERLIRDYLQLRFPVSSFTWQGGEPTLMGLDFYKKVIELQKQHGIDGQVVSNALQTNAVLLDSQWCRFLAQYNFLVGISLDGSKKIHDFYRTNHSGAGSFNQVAQAIDSCRQANVDFNIITLVNNHNVKCPDQLWDFFVEQGFNFLQFVPCVQPDPDHPGRPAHFAVSPEEFGQFICRIFDRWLQHGPRKVSVRLFDTMLSHILTGRHTNCTFAQRCNDYIVVEHNGETFCCDFFVNEQWKLGNIMNTPIDQIFNSPRKKEFADNKRRLADQCLICRFHQICRGGCLKDRFALTNDYHQPSYLCPAYKQFFQHALPHLQNIAQEFRAEQAAVNNRKPSARRSRRRRNH